MQPIRPARPQLEDLVAYDARDVKAEVVLASNENPNNLPAEVIAKLAAGLDRFKFNRYPDPTAHELRRLIAEANGLDAENVMVGNGGDEIIFNLLLAWGGPGRKILEDLATRPSPRQEQVEDDLIPTVAHHHVLGVEPVGFGDQTPQFVRGGIRIAVELESVETGREFRDDLGRKVVGVLVAREDDFRLHVPGVVGHEIFELRARWSDRLH